MEQRLEREAEKIARLIREYREKKKIFGGSKGSESLLKGTTKDDEEIIALDSDSVLGLNMLETDGRKETFTQ